MSDIRKFINIVESVSEDATSPDVIPTDIESNDDQPSKMSNKKKATIALHYLIELDRFIRYARFSSERLAERNENLRTFMIDADRFIAEAKDIIEEISSKPYNGPNDIEEINNATLVTPYNPDLIFRNEKGHFTAAKYDAFYIENALNVIKKGIHLIAGQNGILRLVMNRLKTNNKFRDLTSSWMRGWPELESNLKLISKP